MINAVFDKRILRTIPRQSGGSPGKQTTRWIPHVSVGLKSSRALYSLFIGHSRTSLARTTNSLTATPVLALSVTRRKFWTAVLLQPVMFQVGLTLMLFFEHHHDPHQSRSSPSLTIKCSRTCAWATIVAGVALGETTTWFLYTSWWTSLLPWEVSRSK